MTFFDSKLFMSSLGEDAELAAELMDAYLEDSPVRRATLLEAVNNGDCAVAAKAAHSLKGMSGVVRAGGLVDMALGMEMAAKEEKVDRLKELFAEFDQAFATALGEMHHFRETL